MKREIQRQTFGGSSKNVPRRRFNPFGYLNLNAKE
jgi:hypothetical protein